MRQCTAIDLLPPPETLLGIALRTDTAPGGRVAFPSDLMPCKLGEGHEEGHAALLRETKAARKYVWARWGDPGAVVFVLLPWCGAENGAGERCSLFAEHPSGHDWDVTDPTRD